MMGWKYSSNSRAPGAAQAVLELEMLGAARFMLHEELVVVAVFALAWYVAASACRISVSASPPSSGTC